MSESKIVVCGTGPSIDDFVPHAKDYVTVGVNDIDRWFAPDHLVLINKLSMFSGERRNAIATTGAKTVWSVHGLPNHPDVRSIFPLPVNSHETIDPDVLDGERPISYLTSPFSAVAIAYKIGATKIGLMGVDLVDHPLALHESYISAKFQDLREALKVKGVELWNLSAQSILDIPKMSLEDF